MPYLHHTLALLITISMLLAPASSAVAEPTGADFDGCPVLGTEPAQVYMWKDSVYGRIAPDAKSATSTRLLRGQCFYAVGRDKLNGFLLVRDGNDMVWVHGGDVVWRGDLQKLPFMDTFRATGAVLTTRPQGLPAISGKARQIYANAASQGRDLGIVTVIGDCNSESPVYFGRIASGSFSLGSYPSLQYAAGRFGRSWGRTSVATAGSFNTSSALDPAWANPALCGADAPLQCELRLSRASIIIVALGTGDQFAWQGIASRYRPIIETALAGGVLPVLMTKADALEHLQGGAPADAINNTVRSLGAQYGIPVIDFALGVSALPNGGLANEPLPQFHLSTAGEDLRLIMTLATLGSISAGISYVPPTAPANVSPPPAAPANVSPPPTASASSSTSAPIKPTIVTGVIGSITITRDQINLRAAPNTSAATIAAAKKEQRFDVIGRSDDGAWWQVNAPGGKPAWVFADLAVFIAAPPAALETQIGVATVIRSVALMRDSASFDGLETGQVHAGQSLNVFARNAAEDWVKVSIPDSAELRWVYAAQINIVEITKPRVAYGADFNVYTQ